MGNFSVSHYTGIRVHSREIELRYLLDLAEIPTFQAIQDSGIVPEAGHPTLAPYLARQAAALQEGLRLEVDRRPLDLIVGSCEVLFTRGVGGLPTMKLGFTYRAAFAAEPGGAHLLTFKDGNLPDRVGWQEVIAVPGAGMAFEVSSVPERDRSAELTDYPTDLVGAPPQQREARLVFSPEPESAAATAGGAGSVSSLRLAAAPPRGDATPTSRRGVARRDSAEPALSPVATAAADPRVRTLEPPHRAGLAPDPVEGLGRSPNRQSMPGAPLGRLVATRELSVSVLLAAALVAAGLGALHALEPGHGKTVVAAYLVGSRGTAWHAMVLGVTVTLSHTAGVYLLGAIVLYASSYIVPEHLYPWLTVCSGLLIAGLGVVLLRQRYPGVRRDRDHDYAHHAGSGSRPAHHATDDERTHDHDHAHAHGIADLHGPGGFHVHPVPSTVSLRGLVALGVSGGIVPCPAALVVLLSAVSLNRAGFGLFLIVAFSLGLAAVLIAIGLLMVYARRLMTRIDTDRSLLTRWLPVTSAAIVTLLGVAIAIQAVVNAGLPRLS